MATGFSVYGYLSETDPIKKDNMIDPENTTFNHDLVVHVGLRNISGLVGGLGFWIILICIIIYIVGEIRKKPKGVKK